MSRNTAFSQVEAHMIWNLLCFSVNTNGLSVIDGAEGVMVIGTRSGEVIVWKMSDGSQRGAMTLALASLSHLGIELDIERETVLGGGDVVGEIRASKLVRHG
jgi:uncharacterized protein involved in tellurium resistance